MHQQTAYADDRGSLACAQNSIAQQQPPKPAALPFLAIASRPSTAIGIGSGMFRLARDGASAIVIAPEARLK